MWSVAGHFVRAHPPSSPLMMFYGSEFPVFLEGFEPAKQLPYLPDMARLEHARRLAFHAADDPILTPDALSTVAPEKLGGVRFKLHSSLNVVSSDHAILSIWRFNSTEDKSQTLEEASESATQSSPEFDLGQNIGGLLSAQIISDLQEQ